MNNSSQETKENPRIIVVQKLYGHHLNKDSEISFPKHRFKKFIKDVVKGTIERKELIEESVSELTNVEVDVFEGLLIDYVTKQNCNIVIRGIRAVSDFEFEFQMALMNRKLNEKIETLFMMPRASYSFLSSHLVKEIASLGGDVSTFVSATTSKALVTKLSKKS